MFALKLAEAVGLTVVLSSSSDRELKAVCEQFPEPPVLTVNYAENLNWHEEVLEHTNGVGVDIILENGGPGTLLKSIKCTRRGGIVSQVGYLDRKKFDNAQEIVPTLIDRRIILRFDDLIDSAWAFDNANEALQYLWEGTQVGKVVIQI
ncbi:MAG: hypothetical protein L6R42_005857 [Xanthoria sp. 1 TBL-2021]|nr:MAG: hypothetical protein L6R42_005857 [Xanthoria sp. 1 TBL-2021]